MFKVLGALLILALLAWGTIEIGGWLIARQIARRVGRSDQ